MKKQHQRYADTPQISATAQICLELNRQPDITIGTVTEALATEADAAQRIIALANSELFSSRRTSANLHQALDNLGLHETLILNVACEAFNTLESFPAGGIDRNAFKQRACIAAAWGITLGREFGRRDSAELMLTALMQDVGILLIAQGAPDTYAGLDPLVTDRTSLAQLEFAALNSNHRQAVAWLATTWQLPDNVVRTLRFGHDLAAHDVAPRERGFYRAVNFCGDLAAAWFQPLTVQIVAQLTEDAQQYLGISPDRLVELFNTVSAQVPLLGSILGFEAHAPEHNTEIARKIHQLMPVSNISALSTPATPAPLSESAAPEQVFNLLDATGFAERLNEEFMLTIQHDWPLSLILVEIDGFDDMHLSCGVETSAQIHHEIAALLNRNIRSSDTIGSQSENRFAILLPGSDADMAAMVATRLVDEAHWCIAQHEQAGSLPVTVSLGVATLNEDTPFSRATELSTAAMAALKHSTSSGRDQLTTYASIQAA